MSVMRVCWENTCTNTKVTLCRRCTRPFCDDHLDDATGLCVWCVPVDEDTYNKWRRKEEYEQ